MPLTSVRQFNRCCLLLEIAIAISLQGFAAAAEPPAQSAVATPQPNASVAILKGRVSDEEGKPLAGVRVRVAIPAIDMRFFDSASARKQLQATTDDQGNYQVEIADVPTTNLVDSLSARLGGLLGVEIPGAATLTLASVDAMKPTFRRRSGLIMSWDGETKVNVSGGKTTHADMQLKRSGYFAGTVVDEGGLPIAGVDVHASASGENFGANVEKTMTDENGVFELFNYPETRADLGEQYTDCRVSYFHPDYVADSSGEIYAIDRDQRTKMRVVLLTGYRITGSLKSVSGKPFGGGMVKVVSKDDGHRKAMVTDEQGKFTIRGIPGGEVELSCIDRLTNQKRKLALILDADKDDLQVQLLPISVSTQLKTFDVLGMKLTDVTPELKTAYEFWSDKGALILDPGPDHVRLGIGELVKGDYFWMAGNDQIGTVREFVAEILEEAANPQNALFGVHVVYTFSRPRGDGSSTQYLKLTPDDIQQLQAVLDQFPEVD